MLRRQADVVYLFQKKNRQYHREITNKLRTAGHNFEIERQVVNRHKQHSLLNEYQLDCNLYTKQRNVYIPNFRVSRRYFSLH